MVYSYFTIVIPGPNRYIGEHVNDLIVKWFLTQIMSCDLYIIVLRVQILLGTLFNFHILHHLIGHMAKRKDTGLFSTKIIQQKSDKYSTYSKL